MSEIQISHVKEEEMADLQAASESDNHGLVYPTHIIRKNEEILGSVSMGAGPLVFWWMDSKKAKALDSVRAIKRIEDEYRSYGFKRAFVLCDEESNYFPHMEKMGNHFLLKSNIYVREL